MRAEMITWHGHPARGFVSHHGQDAHATPGPAAPAAGHRIYVALRVRAGIPRP